MTIQYGIWSKTEDGFIERGFWSYESANSAAEELNTAEEIEALQWERDEYTAREMCPDHEDQEQPKEGCELCHADDEEGNQ